MKKKALTRLVLISIVGFANPTFAALTFNSVNNASTLANEILGPGASLSGNAIFTEALPGTFTQASTFSGGLSSGFSFDTGIYLTTGNVIDTDDDLLNSDLGGLDDEDLNSILNTPQPPIDFNTSDAAVLEFSFNWDGGDLAFNYIFASEEYNEFVDAGFNDVFGFFIDGINIALTDTTPLVSVDNFNNGVNNDLYVDNTGGTFDTLYDGFTRQLTATTNLDPGTYIAKIAIADVGQLSRDALIDSGVFIQSNSFSVPIPVPAALPLFLSALIGICLVGKTPGKRLQ